MKNSKLTKKIEHRFKWFNDIHTSTGCEAAIYLLCMNNRIISTIYINHSLSIYETLRPI